MADSSSSARSGGRADGGGSASAGRDPLRQRRMAGLGLLLLALWALAGRYLAFDPGLLVPLLLGVVFTGWSILSREWGLLVPGGILTGVGAGLVVERAPDWQTVSDRGWFLVCFAGGWVLITVVSALVFKRRVLWPLVPAAVLGGIGAARLVAFDLGEVLHWARLGWPFAAGAVALYLLFSRPKG